jgi:hypothetical protein
MTKITNEYDAELRHFADAMRYKMHVNRHKGHWEGAKLEDLFKLLRQEIDELEEEIKSPQRNQIAIVLEASDASNYLMMIANVAMKTATGVEKE